LTKLSPHGSQRGVCWSAEGKVKIRIVDLPNWIMRSFNPRTPTLLHSAQFAGYISRLTSLESPPLCVRHRGSEPQLRHYPLSKVWASASEELLYAPFSGSICLKAMLLALLLHAPSLLHAQSASPPQSQPATQSLSQSQSQDTPACSDAPPILKRGKQPDLPLCPDPSPAASAPTGNTQPHSLSPSAPLIERAREAAFEFSQNLPNFICKEVMARYSQRGRDETPQDVVSAEIIYDHAKETYRNVKIDDRPTDKNLEEINGSWSTGEFATTLLSLFDPATNARFRPGGATTISGFAAQVYDFDVPRANSRWTIHAESQTLVPAYKGSVWVDPSTTRVLRIEMQARNIPDDFPMNTIESAVDYSYIMIGGKSYLLPVHAESLGCPRAAGSCSHNIIDFRNYHEFRVDVKIAPVQNP
jgi:hypothetical protein